MYKYLIILLLFVSCKKAPEYEVIQLDTGTFDIGAEVIITQDTVLARQFIETELEIEIPDNSFDARGVTFSNLNYPIIIWLPKKPVTPEEISIASHELFHTTLRIMEWAGVELNEYTEEVFCFETQYLSKQLYGK